jgi:nucleotide-binding universal stress UspA family protein
MKILVAIDGSKPSLNALKYAIGLVGQWRAEAPAVTIISVHDDVGLVHAKSLVGGTAVADYLRELSERELRTARRLLRAAGVEHEVAIRTGHVAPEIVGFANAGRFDLIVLGAKGRRPIADLLLGSVAQRVLATARQPVLLVK